MATETSPDFGKLFADAKKRSHFFALLIAQEGVIFEADPRKNADILYKRAQKAGGSRGMRGTMSVSGKVVTLTPNSPDFPANILDRASKHFRSLGHQFRFEVAKTTNKQEMEEEQKKAEGPKPADVIPTVTPEIAAARAEFKALSNLIKSAITAADKRRRKAIVTFAKKVASQANTGDLRVLGNLTKLKLLLELPAAKPAELQEEEPVLGGTDLPSLMNGLKKRPYNFAWLIGKEGLVLKAHMRKPLKTLVKQARGEGASAKGALGRMEREGKSIILNCLNEPPKSMARKARQSLALQGIKAKVILRFPGGEIADEDVDAKIEKTVPNGKSGQPAIDARKLAALQKMYSNAHAVGDTGKCRKIRLALDRIEPGLSKALDLRNSELKQSDAQQAAKRAENDPVSRTLDGDELPNMGPTSPPDAAAPSGSIGKSPKKRSAPAGGGGHEEEPNRQHGFPKAIPVDRVMDNLTFSNHVDVWAKGMTLAEAQEENKNPAYRIQPLDFEVTQEHVEQGYVVVVFIVNDYEPVDQDEMVLIDDAFDDLTKNERELINARADELFWERTGFQQGRKLEPNDPHFDELASAWKQIRAEIVQDGQRIKMFPDRLRKFLRFDEENGVPLTPDGYKTLLDLAEKLEDLSDAELADYWNRTSTNTDDIHAFATSVDRYLAAIKAHQDATEERSDAQDKLVAMEDLYQAWDRSKAPRMPQTDEFGQVDMNAVNYNLETDQARAALPELLAKHEYHDIAQFEADIAAYKASFEAEAVHMANEAMDRRAHQLFEFENEVVTVEKTDAMAAALAGIADKRIEMSMDPFYKVGEYPDPVMTNWYHIRLELRPRIEAAIASEPGLTAVMNLLKQEDPDFKLDDEMIDALSTKRTGAEIKAWLEGLLEERRSAIVDTRRLLAEDPDKIWDMDILMAHARADGMVEEGSIHDSILDEEIDDRSTWKMAKNIVLGVTAIGAGLLSGGSGTVAVLGAAAAVGIGAYEGWEAYTTYTEEDAVHLAGLSSNDPSFAWVVLAMATIPLDVMGVGTAVKNVQLARGAAIATMLEKGEVVGDAVRTFNKAQDSLDVVEDPSIIIAKLESDLAGTHEKIRKTIVRYAKAEMEANAAFARAMKSGGRAYAAIDPVVTPVAIMASRFAYPVFLWFRKGIVGLEQFLNTRHAVALVGKLDDLKALDGALPNVKAAYKEAKEYAEEISKAARRLDMTDLDLDEAAKFWSQRPAMSPEEFIAKLPIFKQARERLGPLEDLAKEGSDAARRAYQQELVDAQRIATQCERFGLSADDVSAVLEHRALTPDMPLDDFLDLIPAMRADPGVPSPITGRPNTVLRTTDPVGASGAVPNPAGATGRNRSVSGKDLMDADTQDQLKGLGPDNLDHDIAGTGGIEKIRAGADPGDPTSQWVEIEGEILPGRLQRDPSVPLKPGQSHAPNFNGNNALEAINKLGFNSPDDWQRLHLWGPGFGDEAAAGMYLGPREINLDWQNSGVEELIRELGRQVAPHRGAGFKLKVKAKAKTWGVPTPKGFETPNGEKLFKEASYEVILETPNGTKSARIDITSQTDPFDINLGKDPGVHIGFDEAAFNLLFKELPE